MSYDTILEKKIEDVTLSWETLEKKKMFGGICYLINGNMSFGIWKDNLIVRMAPELAVEKLKDQKCKRIRYHRKANERLGDGGKRSLAR